jgi:hypothetical protein
MFDYQLPPVFYWLGSGVAGAWNARMEGEMYLNRACTDYTDHAVIRVIGATRLREKTLGFAWDRGAYEWQGKGIYHYFSNL